MTYPKMTTANRAPHPRIERAIRNSDTPERMRRELVDSELTRLHREEHMLNDWADEDGWSFELNADIEKWLEDIRVYRHYILKLLESDIPL